MKERSYGLDLYRIMAMLMITALHVNYQHCNLLNNWTLPGGLRCAGVIIEYICFAGVNCFAMLSGYVMGNAYTGYDRRWGYRCVSFWSRMVFWGVFLFLLVFCVFPGGREYPFDFTGTFFPFIGFWWYISAYCGLLILMPLLSAGVNQLPVRQIVILLLTMPVFFSVIPALGKSYGFLGLNNGYSTLWLAICFIYGVSLKKLAAQILEIKRINLILILLLLASIVVPVTLELTMNIRYMEYTTLFCVVESACLLLLFLQIRISSKRVAKMVAFVSSNSLGIYLVQNYPYFWENYIIRHDPPIYEPVKYLWYLPGVILLLMIIGVMVNFIVDHLYKFSGCDRLCRLLLPSDDRR